MAPFHRKKIIPISRFAACFITGISDFTDLKGLGKGKAEILREVHLGSVISDWGKAHPDAQLPEAYDQIDGKIVELMNNEERKHGELSADHTNALATFSCVGYFTGVPMVYSSIYAQATGEQITRQVQSGQMHQGNLVAIGKAAVCEEVKTGRAAKEMADFKSEPAIVKYRKGIASRDRSGISTNDLLVMSRICLEATESDEGRRFDADASDVGPPNSYAVIDEHRGFNWVSKPPRR